MDDPEPAQRASSGSWSSSSSNGGRPSRMAANYMLPLCQKNTRGGEANTKEGVCPMAGFDAWTFWYLSSFFSLLEEGLFLSVQPVGLFCVCSSCGRGLFFVCFLAWSNPTEARFNRFAAPLCHRHEVQGDVKLVNSDLHPFVALASAEVSAPARLQWRHQC